jgi:hypothetical protein
MSSICDRLREMADLFEAQQAPPNFVLHLRVGADEIARLTAEVLRLRAALEEVSHYSNEAFTQKIVNDALSHAAASGVTT